MERHYENTSFYCPTEAGANAPAGGFGRHADWAQRRVHRRLRAPLGNSTLDRRAKAWQKVRPYASNVLCVFMAR